MPAHWETGVVCRTPTWHRLEKAVLPEHITDWDVGRKLAGIDWEVYTDDVYVKLPDGSFGDPLAGQQAIRRDDTHEVLAIQPASYAVVNLAQFGDVITAIAGGDLRYEAIFSLYEGKMIVALLYFDEPLYIAADSGVSKTMQYLCMQQRFDGQGGIRGLPTSVRTICANTVNMAEALDGKDYGFSIRHTTNWEDRVDQAAQLIRGARRDAAAWAAIANRLSAAKFTGRDRDIYLERFLPTATDMTDRQIEGVDKARFAVRQLLQTPTNAHIADTAYGLVMASTEWADHVRAHRNTDSLVARQLIRKEPLKARALRIACQQAGINRRELVAAAS